jgi:hypothetical protein
MILDHFARSRALAVADAVALPVFCVAFLFSTHMRAGLVGGVLVALVCLRAMKRVRVAYSSRSRYRFDIARLAIALFVVIVFDLVLVGTHDAFR